MICSHCHRRWRHKASCAAQNMLDPYGWIEAAVNLVEDRALMVRSIGEALALLETLTELYAAQTADTYQRNLIFEGIYVALSWKRFELERALKAFKNHEPPAQS
jgi:hypothetical protein